MVIFQSGPPGQNHASDAGQVADVRPAHDQRGAADDDGTSRRLTRRPAPDQQRAELLSTYLPFCYAGVSLPPVGVGILGQLASPDIADITFAATIATIAVVGFAFGARFSPRRAGRSSGEEAAHKGAAA